MKILHIEASILGENSVSRQLTAAIVKRLRQANPAAKGEAEESSAFTRPNLRDRGQDRAGRVLAPRLR